MSDGRHAGKFTHRSPRDSVVGSAINVAVTLFIYGVTTAATGLGLWLAAAVWAGPGFDTHGVAVTPNLLGGVAWLVGVVTIAAWAYAVAYALGFAFARAGIYPQARFSVISGYYYLLAFVIAFGPVCAMAELFSGERVFFAMAVAAFIVLVPVGCGAQHGLSRVTGPARAADAQSAEAQSAEAG